MADELRIMAVGEIAKALGVSPGRVHQVIRDNPTFPRHAIELGVGKIWRTEDVEAWIAARKAKAEERTGR